MYTANVESLDGSVSSENGITTIYGYSEDGLVRFDASFPEDLEQGGLANGSGLWTFAEVWIISTTDASWSNDSGDWTGQWNDESGQVGDLSGELGTDVSFYEGWLTGTLSNWDGLGTIEAQWQISNWGGAYWWGSLDDWGIFFGTIEIGEDASEVNGTGYPYSCE